MLLKSYKNNDASSITRAQKDASMFNQMDINVRLTEARLKRDFGTNYKKARIDNRMKERKRRMECHREATIKKADNDRNEALLENKRRELKRIRVYTEQMLMQKLLLERLRKKENAAIERIKEKKELDNERQISRTMLFLDKRLQAKETQAAAQKKALMERENHHRFNKEARINNVEEQKYAVIDKRYEKLIEKQRHQDKRLNEAAAWEWMLEKQKKVSMDRWREKMSHLQLNNDNKLRNLNERIEMRKQESLKRRKAEIAENLAFIENLKITVIGTKGYGSPNFANVDRNNSNVLFESCNSYGQTLPNIFNKYHDTYTPTQVVRVKSKHDLKSKYSSKRKRKKVQGRVNKPVPRKEAELLDVLLGELLHDEVKAEITNENFCRQFFEDLLTEHIANNMVNEELQKFHIRSAFNEEICNIVVETSGESLVVKEESNRQEKAGCSASQNSSDSSSEDIANAQHKQYMLELKKIRYMRYSDDYNELIRHAMETKDSLLLACGFVQKIIDQGVDAFPKSSGERVFEAFSMGDIEKGRSLLLEVIKETPIIIHNNDTEISVLSASKELIQSLTNSDDFTEVSVGMAVKAVQGVLDGEVSAKFERKISNAVISLYGKNHAISTCSLEVLLSASDNRSGMLSSFSDFAADQQNEEPIAPSSYTLRGFLDPHLGHQGKLTEDNSSNRSVALMSTCATLGSMRDLIDEVTDEISDLTLVKSSNEGPPSTIVSSPSVSESGYRQGERKKNVSEVTKDSQIATQGSSIHDTSENTSVYDGSEASLNELEKSSNKVDERKPAPERSSEEEHLGKSSTKSDTSGTSSSSSASSKRGVSAVISETFQDISNYMDMNQNKLFGSDEFIPIVEGCIKVLNGGSDNTEHTQILRNLFSHMEFTLCPQLDTYWSSRASISLFTKYLVDKYAEVFETALKLITQLEDGERFSGFRKAVIKTIIKVANGEVQDKSVKEIAHGTSLCLANIVKKSTENFSETDVYEEMMRIVDNVLI